MATTYYGLKNSSGTIIKCGWSSEPTFYLCLVVGKYGSVYNSAYGYALNYNSTYYISKDNFGTQTKVRKYNSTGYSFDFIPSWFKVAQYTPTSCWWWYNYSISGYSQTKTLSVGNTVCDTNKNTYTVCSYSSYTATVKKVLNNGTVTTVSTNTYDAGKTVTVSIPTAYSNSVLSGVLIDNGAQTYKSNGYSLTMNDDHVILFQFTSTVNITLNVGTGGSSLQGSSTTSFTKTTSSATANSSSKTIVVEKGQKITLVATAETGYVLTSNAITSSNSSYGTTTGDGKTSYTTTKVCTVATTFTVKGTQYTITPQIVDGGVGKSGWGTAKINYSSGSVALKPNTTYTLGFTSSTSNTYAPIVNYWSIGGSNYSTSFTTGSSITSNITAYLYIEQTKWLLSVENGSNYSWGTVSGSGWYASGTQVALTFTPSSSVSNLGITTSQVNYNGETVDFNSGDKITTTNSSQTATIYLKQTKFKMSLVYGTDGTESWGTISADKEYVGTGDSVTFTFKPTESITSTIHPIVDHWGLLTQSLKPTANTDGSSSITVTLGTVMQDFTASCYLSSAYRRVTIKRTDTFEAKWGSFYLDESGTTTDKYYAPGSTITIRFVRDTAYDTKERPQVDTIEIGNDESELTGQDGVYSYTYTLQTGIKTDLTISGILKQTAWPITVKSGTGGAVTAKRLSEDKEILEAVTAEAEGSQSIYLCTWQFLAITSTPSEHYKFSAWTQTNLTATANEGQYKLTEANAASVSGAFERSDFSITIKADDDEHGTICFQSADSDGGVVEYFDKDATTNPVVVYRIKSAYSGLYKVASWTIGAQSGIESQYNVSGDFYYCEVTSRSDVVVTAHVVRTTFKLTIKCGPDDYATFGSLVVIAGSKQVKEFNTNGDTEYSYEFKETTAIVVDFYQKYGGRVLSFEPSAEIVNPSVGDNSYSFAMPSADCSLTITLGAKETYNITVSVKNSSEGHEQNIPATLKVTSRTYSTVVVGETDESGVAKTFSVYKDEEYAISVAEEFYSRKYKILGWKDENDAWIDGADGNSISFSNDGTTNLTRTLVYGVRETGTVTIEYAKRENGVITTLDACPEDCSFTIENTEDKIDDTHWLVGADIKMPYTVIGTGFDKDGDAYKWTPVEVDVAFGDDDYSTNASWDDGLLTQDGEFAMRGNVRVCVIFLYEYVPGYTSMRVGYKANSNKNMGSVSFFATEMDAYTEDTTGTKALIRKTKKCVIMASPRPGYAFAGWWLLNDAGKYEAVENAAAVYEIDGANVTSPMPTYYAEFFSSLISNVKEWNGNTNAAKTFVWQSKVYVGAQFFQMQSVRIYSDAYPVKLTVLGASSPEDIFGDTASKQTITITSQEPRRLPRMHTEKYFAFSVSGTARINHVGISSSMIGLTS